MMDLVGKVVEVGTVETVYIGRLVEINETEVHIESDMGWMMIPVERVVFLREKEED